MKKYLELQKKYNLPDFDELNQAFDIEEIESSLILQKIRIKIIEKLDFYAKMFEAVLQPDSNLSTLYEAKYLNEKQRNQAYKLFKKLMFLIRKGNLTSVENSEKGNAIYIIFTFNKWNHIKKDLKNHFTILSEMWKKETSIQNDLSYFG
jgi:hypothetical protein